MLLLETHLLLGKQTVHSLRSSSMQDKGLGQGPGDCGPPQNIRLKTLSSSFHSLALNFLYQKERLVSVAKVSAA